MPTKRKDTATPRYVESTANRDYPHAYPGKTKAVVREHITDGFRGRGAGAAAYARSITRPPASAERTGGMMGALSDISKSVRGALNARDQERAATKPKSEL